MQRNVILSVLIGVLIGFALFALLGASGPQEVVAAEPPADLTITNGVYGVLTDSDIQHTIASLGQAPLPDAGGEQDSLVDTLEMLLAQLKRGK